MILTVPNAIIAQMGWQVGNTLNIEAQGDNVILSPVKRQARGRKSLAELLDGIDSQEIAELNASIAESVALSPQGKEVW
ncbi:antitoxin [Mannheimia granulomatis]|uniref:Antitoxin n=2 Tax=Mannheimia granulomatis TaxID=85402 RepID=A0A6G8JHP5_9PAST|nr:antitoxin [Mannheimia granulomatis]